MRLIDIEVGGYYAVQDGGDALRGRVLSLTDDNLIDVWLTEIKVHKIKRPQQILRRWGEQPAPESRRLNDIRRLAPRQRGQAMGTALIAALGKHQIRAWAQPGLGGSVRLVLELAEADKLIERLVNDGECPAEESNPHPRGVNAAPSR